VEQAPAKMMTVCVKSAQDLPAADWFPGTDRFLYFGVGADVGGEEFFKSQQRKNVFDPVWNEEFEAPADIPLNFTVFQSDADGKVDTIGCATLDLAFCSLAEFHGELPLELEGKAIGSLMLKAKSGDTYPPETGCEFTASIENSKKKAIGLEVDNSDPAKLFVVGVKKGTVTDSYNGEQPDYKVEAGCFIVSVTGADAGSASVSQAMEKILKKNPKQLDLVCRRSKKFRVAVTLPENGMGIEGPKKPLGNSLLVVNIKPNGAVEAWNADNPEQIVQQFDRVVAVDAKPGKAADLLKRVKAAKKGSTAVLTVVRMTSEVASEEDAPEPA